MAPRKRKEVNDPTTPNDQENEVRPKKAPATTANQSMQHSSDDDSTVHENENNVTEEVKQLQAQALSFKYPYRCICGSDKELTNVDNCVRHMMSKGHKRNLEYQKDPRLVNFKMDNSSDKIKTNKGIIKYWECLICDSSTVMKFYKPHNFINHIESQFHRSKAKEKQMRTNFMDMFSKKAAGINIYYIYIENRILLSLFSF